MRTDEGEGRVARLARPPGMPSRASCTVGPAGFVGAQLTHQRVLSGNDERTVDHKGLANATVRQSSSVSRAQALAEVATAIGLPRAGRLLGEAFAVGSWLTPLPALAKLYPQLAIRIADAVYADDRW